MDLTMSCSCHSVRISFALWRHRKDSPIPVSTWHCGFPINTTRSRRPNTWKDCKLTCTITFKGLQMPHSLVTQQISLYFKSVFPFNLYFSLMFYMFFSALSLKMSLWLASWHFTLWLWSPPAIMAAQPPLLSIIRFSRCWRTWRSRWNKKKSTFTVTFPLTFLRPTGWKNVILITVNSCLNIFWFLLFLSLLLRSQPPRFDQLLPVLSGSACSLCEWRQGQQPCQQQAHQGSRGWALHTWRHWEYWWVNPV